LLSLSRIQEAELPSPLAEVHAAGQLTATDPSAQHGIDEHVYQPRP
jgi:hypothetical protein